MALMMEEKYDDLAGLRERAKAEVGKVVVGQDRTVELLLVAALAHGHVLLEGPPGSAKTLLGRAVAHMFGAKFKRIQFTPDTTPAELNGINVDQGRRARLPPGRRLHERPSRRRDQPHRRRAPRPPSSSRCRSARSRSTARCTSFPIRSSSSRRRTRTSTRASSSSPSPSSTASSSRSTSSTPTRTYELAMLNLPHNGIAPDMLGEVRPLLGVVGLDKARAGARGRPRCPTSVGRYIVSLGRRTRDMPGVELGVSSRAMIHLMSASKANARLNGRSHRHDRRRPRDGAVRPESPHDPHERARRRRGSARGRWTRCRHPAHPRSTSRRRFQPRTAGSGLTSARACRSVRRGPWAARYSAKARCGAWFPLVAG